MTSTPARDALARRMDDLSETYPEPVDAALDNPALTLAALVEAHGLDEVLRALGGYCGNCDGAGGCMSCRFREQHGYCEHDCPECGPEPWNERTREWTFPRPAKETTDE